MAYSNMPLHTAVVYMHAREASPEKLYIPTQKKNICFAYIYPRRPIPVAHSKKPIYGHDTIGPVRNPVSVRQ